MGGTSVATGCGVGYYESHAREGIAAAQERGYYSKAVAAGEPRAELLGRGLGGLGLTFGQELSNEVAQSTWDQLRHPVTGVQLGQRVAKYAGPGVRFSRAAEASGVVLPEALAQGLAKGGDLDLSAVRAAVAPLVTPEELATIERAAGKARRESVSYYDTLYTQDKTVSVAHAAADAAGDHRASEVCEESMRRASEAIVSFIDDTLYVRAGNHGKSVEGRSSGRYEKANGVSVAAYRHHTSRAGDMHDHVHLLVLNRAQSAAGGPFRALDGTMLFNSNGATTALGSRAAEMHITAELGWRWEKRVDGTRYLAAVEPGLVDQFSKRAAAIEQRLDQWAQDYERDFGRVPTPKERDRQHRDIQRRTRAAKPDEMPSRAEAVSKWDAEVEKSLTGAHSALSADALAWSKSAPERHAAVAIDTSAVLDEALAALTEKRSTFTRWHLVAEIDKAMPANLPAGMTFGQYRQVALGLADQGVRRLGVESLTPVGVLDRNVPAEFAMDAGTTGRSVFSPPDDDRYANVDTLAQESYLLGELSRLDAPGLASLDAERASVALGLTGDQRRAVTSILGSHRRVDVLVGPPGVGKSYVVARLADGWKAEGLGEVVGLAKSNAAAAVLAGEGVDKAWNVDRWLMAQRRIGAGRGRPRDAAFKLSPGALVVVDEASMAETKALAEVVEVVRRNGGKVLLTGDHRQISSVGAGGFFELVAEDPRLCSDGAVVELTEVRRFQNDWEGAASLRLRSGDDTVLELYDRNGRILTVDDGDGLDLACEQWVTDHLDGKEAVVVVATSEQASAAAMKIRTELITLGRVDSGLAVELANGGLASVGDVIQARTNNYVILDSDGQAVNNRDRLVVTKLSSDGGLTARRSAGRATVDLPADYVAGNVELSYARTAHGAQGMTVDRSYNVVSKATDRAGLLVGLTRGREANFAVVSLAAAVDEHGHGQQGANEEGANPLEVITEALGRSNSERSALAEQRAQVEAAESLARLGPAWSAAVALSAERAERAEISAVLGSDRLRRLDQEAAAPAFWHQVAATRRAGIDPADALRSTMAGREVDTADELSSLLAWRLSGGHNMAWEPARFAQDRSRSSADTTYLDRSPAPEALASDSLSPDAVGSYARQLATAMDARVAELGRRTAAEAPEWATHHLGPVPAVGTTAREDWETKAGWVAGYREQYVTSAHVSVSDPIGPAPSAVWAPERSADWRLANDALAIGRGPQWSISKASDGELRRAVTRWDDEAARAPAYVAHELPHARNEVRQLHGRAVRLEAIGVAGPVSSARLAELRTHEAQAERYVAALEEMNTDRVAWFEDSAIARASAREAAAELARRYPDRDAAYDVGPEPEELSPSALAHYERKQRQELAVERKPVSPTFGISM